MELQLRTQNIDTFLLITHAHPNALRGLYAAARAEGQEVAFSDDVIIQPENECHRSH